METVLSLNERSANELSSEKKAREVEKSFEGLILKELPKPLKYVFLGEEKSKPVIITIGSTTEKVEKVKEILRRNKDAIAWSMEDLKGINPSICMQKIFMDENARTSI